MQNKIDKKDIFIIPNILTYCRFLITTGFIVLMAFAGINADLTLFYCGLGMFLLAAATDVVDGVVARKCNMISGLGKILDPIADKFMHISALLCLSLCTGLTSLGATYAAFTGGWYIHYAFVILIIAKELAMGLATPFIVKKGIIIQANMLGKVASVTLSAAVFLGFFHPYVMCADWGILSWGIALSYAAGASYVIETVKKLKATKNSGEEVENENRKIDAENI